MFLASCCAIITDLIERSVNFSNTALTDSLRLLLLAGARLKPGQLLL
jgi:hypothetical protein